MTTPSEKPPLLLWLDVETTDLDPSKDLLLEVAWAVTKLDGSDVDFVPSTQDHGSSLIYYVPGLVERAIKDPVVLDMHTKSGLLYDLETLSHTLHADPVYPTRTPAFVDRLVHDSLRPWANNHTLHPAGRNVASFDRQFLKKTLPSVDALLSFKHFDVTALRLVGDLLGTPWVEVPFVGTKHRAVDDVSHDVTCWRATLRALGGRKVLNAPSSSLLRPEIPSFDETKRRLAALSKAYEDGLEGRIQAHVDTGVRDFQGQLDDMDGRHTRSYIRVGCGDSLDLEMIEARKRLADMFTQQGYRVILTTTYVEVRLS